MKNRLVQILRLKPADFFYREKLFLRDQIFFPSGRRLVILFRPVSIVDPL